MKKAGSRTDFGGSRENKEGDGAEWIGDEQKRGGGASEMHKGGNCGSHWLNSKY